ncbi:hypothetical protein BCR42DRAFT_40574 [Absidia repens]|uniref:CDP-alcohol phosphatidyltransferase-domain-containing protein n=1 Tax=Absidia repens TaxID=90262 RepID=A0A1X2IFH1_9FUNG|nr:hypothetical protein BCR42DRAFT_40574 [Absidia repens]
MLTSIQVRLLTTCNIRHRSFTSISRTTVVSIHQILPTSSMLSTARNCLRRKPLLSTQWRAQYQKALVFYNTSNRPSDESPANKLKQKTENAKVVINKLKDVIPTHENIYTIPNFLTFSRLLSAPFIGYLITQHNYDVALGVFALAGFTDMLDGYIARRYNLKTVVGSIIDPAADKTLMTVMTISLAMEGVLPLPLAGVILGRDVGLVIAAFYYRYISLPAPKTFARYWDFSIPSAEVRPTTISKVNTALQLLLMGSSLTTMSMGVPSAEIMTAMHWIVGTTTVWSGASYIYSKDAVRILSQAK